MSTKKNERPASSRGAGYDTLTSRSEGSEFARALEQATSLKR